MRKLVIGIAVVALLALLALPVMAAPGPNPWDGCCDVDVTITIPEIAELWSHLGTGQERSLTPAPIVTVTNAGGIIPQTGIAEDKLWHCSNIPVTVWVTLESTPGIPPWTRFHVIVGVTNRGDYNCVGAWPNGAHGANYTIVNATATDSTITWDRGATTYSGKQPDFAYVAFDGSAGPDMVPHLVDYAVDAINGMPAVGSSTPTVMWTIAPS